MTSTVSATPLAAKLLSEIESLAEGLSLTPAGTNPVVIQRGTDRAGRDVWCATIGDPSFSLLAGFGASDNAALLDLLRRVRESHSAWQGHDGRYRLSETAMELARGYERGEISGRVSLAG